jgi:hypothetical protein
VAGVGDEDVVVPEEEGDRLYFELGGILGTCGRVVAMASRPSESRTRAEEDEKECHGAGNSLKRIRWHGQQRSSIE